MLIAIGVVVILGALLGVAWRERHEHPTGEQPHSSAEPDRLQHRAGVWEPVDFGVPHATLPRRATPGTPGLASCLAAARRDPWQAYRCDALVPGNAAKEPC